MGSGGTWSGDGVNFGSSDFQSTVLGEAVKSATDELSSKVAADNAQIRHAPIPVQGLIAAVDPKQVILNLGARAGLKVGDELKVERVTQVVRDPATGSVIKQTSVPIGVIKVTSVDDTSAAGVPVSGSDFKVGDTVKGTPR